MHKSFIQALIHIGMYTYIETLRYLSNYQLTTLTYQEIGNGVAVGSIFLHVVTLGE